MSLLRNFKAYLLTKITHKNHIDFDIKEAKDALFFRYDRIGDMVITTPVFRELKRVYPDINIIVIASKSNKDVIDNNPYIDEIYVNNKNNLLSDIKTLLSLRRRKIDVCFEFDHSVVPHAIIRLKLIKPRKVISVEKSGRYGVSGSNLDLYDFYTPKKEKTHFREIWLKTLSPLDIEPISSNYDLFLSNQQKKNAIRFLNSFNNKFKVGINLKGAVKGKKIHEDELKKICKEIRKQEKNVQFIILSAPKNYHQERILVKELNLSYVIQSYKTNKILEVAALVKYLDMIITPDTSISHIASAFNTPIVTIHENNIKSYELFAPKSKINKTFFSKESNSLIGYDVDALINYCSKIIKKMKK